MLLVAKDCQKFKWCEKVLAVLNRTDYLEQIKAEIIVSLCNECKQREERKWQP